MSLWVALPPAPWLMSMRGAVNLGGLRRFCSSASRTRLSRPAPALAHREPISTFSNDLRPKL